LVKVVGGRECVYFVQLQKTMQPATRRYAIVSWTFQSTMPARSKKQQMAAGAALAAKRGERKKSSLRGASKKMAESMSEDQLRDFAKTKRKKLPTKKA
jgi:hypothetical protein